MLLAAWRQDFVQTFVSDLADVDAGAAADTFDSLAAAARARMAEEGLDPARAVSQFAADLRYRGQEHTIAVPVGSAGDLEGGGSAGLRAEFDRLHERRYGHAAPDETIQMVNLRLTIELARDDPGMEGDWLAAPFAPEDAQPDQTRPVIHDDPENPVMARIVWRPGLAAGSAIEGPAVIEEPNSTTLLFSGDVARITEHGHIDIAVASASEGEEDGT